MTDPKRGFPGLHCPKCGQETISLDADDMLIRCRECEEETTKEEVHKLIDVWQRFLAWIETAPEVK